MPWTTLQVTNRKLRYDHSDHVVCRLPDDAGIDEVLAACCFNAFPIYFRLVGCRPVLCFNRQVVAVYRFILYFLYVFSLLHA